MQTYQHLVLLEELIIEVLPEGVLRVHKSPFWMEVSNNWRDVLRDSFDWPVYRRVRVVVL